MLFLLINEKLKSDTKILPSDLPYLSYVPEMLSELFQLQVN